MPPTTDGTNKVVKFSNILWAGIRHLLGYIFPNMSSTQPPSPVSTKTSGSDIITNLTNLLPTGTFLTFQAVAPLFTNNGYCGHVEWIMTGILLSIFAFIIVLLSFTDSITTTSGKHYYGIVTTKGMYNPQFKGSNIAGVGTGTSASFYVADKSKYTVSIFDFTNAILSCTVFAVLVLLTPPVSSCYFPSLPKTIVKSVPIVVGIVAGFYFSFSPPPRKGIGYSITGLVEAAPDHEMGNIPAGTASKGGDHSSIPEPAQKKTQSSSPAPTDSKKSIVFI